MSDPAAPSRGEKHRFAVARLEGDRAHFTPAQVRQLRQVLRLGPGDRVRVFDGQRPLDHLVRLELAAGDLVGRVEAEIPMQGEPRARLTAYPALLQRDKLEQVLQKLVEVGVTSIRPTLTARGVVRAAPDAPRLDRWRAILREAAEQSGRSIVPGLELPAPLARALAEAEGTRLVAAVGSHHSLREALRGSPPRVALFVGPEGGFAPEELAAADAAGAAVVSLGPRTLRSETASPVFAALVLQHLGEL